MIKMCHESIVFPLKLIFKSALKFGVYPNKWKKANVFPVSYKRKQNFIDELKTNIIITYML